MKICLLAIDGVFDTGLTVILDAFRMANNFAPGTPPFEITLAGVKSEVRTAQGFVVPTKPLNPRAKPDWVIIPALSAAKPEQLIDSLSRPDVVEARTQLVEWHRKGARVGASCMGTFTLAEAGLLDGGEATTTWWLAPLFRKRYPQVKLDESRMLVPSGRVVTAGAALGHLDLALWLIRTASPELSGVVSRYLLADLRSSQAQYIIPNHLAKADPLILKFEQWARTNLKTGFSLADAAHALGTSSRSLQRRCHEVLGKSPLGYFQDLRVERARSLLHGSGLGLEAIAAEVGYEDGATLRSLLRERLGRGVRDLRAELR